jgi:hypothetical protein
MDALGQQLTCVKPGKESFHGSFPEETSTFGVISQIRRRILT